MLKLKKHIKESEIEEISRKLSASGHSHIVTRVDLQTVIGLEKPISDAFKLELGDAIEESISISTPFKLASWSFKPEKTVIEVGSLKIGGGDVVLMAGPCAIESVEQLVTCANELKKSGVAVLRASAFKPRTSPYSFQGHGLEGLKMHREAQKQHGLLIETEVMDVRQVALAAEYVDILRVGARNMQNFDLLKELGKCNKPVILKRGASATVEEWILSAEYIMAHGNPNVILCERGIRTFETATRNTLDLSGAAVARELTHLPIIVDPSHAAGRKDILGVLCKAAVALGADGLLVEVHPRPKESICDAKQSLSPAEFEEIAKDLKGVARAVGRTIGGAG